MKDQVVQRIFSANLQRFMARENLSQRELAKKLGTGVSTVNDWVNAKQVPRAPLLGKLMDLFDCRLSQLLTDGNQTANCADLTEDEMEFLFLLRNASGAKRDAIKALLR